MHIRTHFYPPPEDWSQLQQRPQIEHSRLQQDVNSIMAAVATDGDAALRQLTRKFDKVDIKELQISLSEIESAADELPAELKQAIARAITNIRTFHQAQKPLSIDLQTSPGVRCWREARAIEKVGLYVPGGSAPLFSTLLMLAIPAQLAGCRQIAVCTPPGSDGQVDASIRFVLAALGLRTAFRVGGAQAIAALTYGTESIPAVDKIFGPGNQYVTMAKQLAAMRGVSIDMPAGPSEVAIIADAGADADFIAADLLSQAEHGPDSQVILLTWAEDLPEKVDAAIARYLPQLPRHEITAAALRHARIVVLRERDLCIAFANEYAAEHLIINCEEASAIAAQINHAGSVFVGRNTPEAAGDYASGTNHTLPTGGYARSLSGVGLESFSKYITFQEITPAGVYDLGPVIETMARAEQLQAHALAMRLRRDKLEAK